ncbi:hypothetical protein L226DRAFT_524552 [Lentinus tigrinus ALCF2SS1-7]|uniref:F-box domain-containing protein n=1 Tax=Lentinus tigrinus ALCF2SS1-6 TaxID=1328759 RepID=A0A5C2S624_9APHY|nr:hypothetical protein L227DRAFT_564631 [Lentinus tigrinus ALCF2SS1-6]RPD72829.1 hypothetical protein L226DRAFT_524552 [Lentinus tigrinus ALCF2SS1-7]
MGSSTSRQSRFTARPRTLLDLPVEVQVKILCYLDTGDLVACRSVCRTLLAICNDEMAVQYTSTLGGAGMVDDVPPQDVSLLDRYVAILKYLIAWMNVDSIPHRIQAPTQGEIFLEHTNGVSVYTIQDHARPALKLHRPGTWTSVLETQTLSRARYTVDLSQDLLIISLRVEGQEENMEALVNDPYESASDKLEDWRGYLGWRTHVLMHSGQRYKANKVIYYHLIDRNYIVLILNNSIHGFSFDPDRASDGPPAYARPGAHLLHLQLPRFEIDVQLSNDTMALLHIPRPHLTDLPLFRQDPGAALLVLMMVVKTFAESGSKFWRPSHLTIFVPLSTIRTHLGRASARILRTPALPWQDWGPGGVRVVCMHDIGPLHISLHGSRCVLTNDGSLNAKNVLVIDSYRWVRQRIPQAPCKLLVGGKEVDASELVTFITEEPFRGYDKPRGKTTERIEGRFPCRMMYEPISIGVGLRWNTTFATDDEVVLVLC